MNEKEMSAHIKALTKIIENQVKYAQESMQRFYNMERTISVLNMQMERIKGERK